MYNDMLDVTGTVSIIDRATLEDASILKNNYQRLVYSAVDGVEKAQFIFLLASAKLRMKALSDNT
jgi:hypothetical protein